MQQKANTQHFTWILISTFTFMTFMLHLTYLTLATFNTDRHSNACTTTSAHT